MAIILSVDTATTVCSVALHKNSNLLALKELHLDKSHAEYLLLNIKDLLDTCGLKTSNLDAIAFSSGPGSYTGLRIGSSTVKGLCYAHSIPLIAVSTLEAMAKQLQIPFAKEVLLCPMIDARRMEVYSALYSNSGETIMPVQPVLIDNNSFEQYFDSNQILFFGNGAHKCKGILNEKALFIDNINPSAVTVGELAYNKYVEKDFEEIAYFEPFYLKEFHATTPKVKSF